MRPTPIRHSLTPRLPAAPTPNRSRWMRAGGECMAAGAWAGAIRAYAQGLMEQPQEGPPAVGIDPRGGAVGAAAGAQLPGGYEPGSVNQAWELVQQQPADLVHLSKPRLPAVLVERDDEELLFVGEREPITLDRLKRLCHGLLEPRELMRPVWTRLAVDLAQRFDGITLANRPLRFKRRIWNDVSFCREGMEPGKWTWA